MLSCPWLVLITIIFAVLALPVYTVILAVITIIRAKCRQRDNADAYYGYGKKNPKNHSPTDNSLTPNIAASSPWSHIRTSLFQGTVFHIRHRPVIHAFKYPLYFAVVELDEASELFGNENVIPATLSFEEQQQQQQHAQTFDPRGTLWPLSSLMLLRDIDHLKNGEGQLLNNTTTTITTSLNSNTATTTTTAKATKIIQSVSMRERICNLVHERTNGKLDLRNLTHNNNNDETTKNERSTIKERQRRIILVTHLMYYGYCFNPVSLFFILKSAQVKKEDERVNYEQETTEDKVVVEAEEIEAIVVEVSNTPWNEMSIYVLHPDSVDTLEHTILYPRTSSSASSATTTTNTIATFDTTIHRYRWRKNFHVSPFMTMDFDYDWKFQVSCNRIKVEATMVRRPEDNGEMLDVTNDKGLRKTMATATANNTSDGQLYFTAGFDIQRTILHPPSLNYPLQVARIILRFPIYCFVIQLWIHYEAFNLLMKGVQFIPHPQGSETGASRAIAAVMSPIFGAMEVMDAWWSRRKGEEKCKDA